MITLFRCVKSDFYKLKHTPILWLHFFIPLTGALLFLSYYSFNSWSTTSKISGYFEVLGVVFPLLIGLMSGMVMEQEEQVGNFQMLFSSTKCKAVTYLSKLIVLLLLALFSIIIAVGVFALGFKNAEPIFYVKAVGILFVSNIFLYILHMLVSLRFGKGTSIGLGISGSLISALMITGLGDRCWKWMPWAFGVRFCDCIVFKKINPLNYNIISREVNIGVFIMILEICIGLIASLLWFQYWQGKKSYE